MNKISRKEAIVLVKEFVEEVLSKEKWYKNIELEVKAVVLYGSVAKEVNRADSDIDVYIILPLEFEEKFTVGEYFYDFKGRKMNIVLRSIERMRKLAQEQNNAFEAEILCGCKIIWEKDGEVKKLIEQISGRSQRPFRLNTEGYFLTGEGELLAQVQNNILVFPGGGVEKDESAQEAIVREVFEETGAIVEKVHFLGTMCFVWSDSWAKTEKQKKRFEQFQGEEMHFFTGQIKEFKEPTGDDEWTGTLLMPVREAIAFLESQKPFTSEASYRDKQLIFLKTIQLQSSK